MGSKTGTKSRRSSTNTAPLAGRYELLRQLGKGGGGTVYLAHDLQNKHQEVALKTLNLKKQKDPALALALQNEFAALTQLRHPNLAKVYDFGITEHESYLAVEFIPGNDLLTATSKADLNTVFRCLLQILRAVDYLHRRGVLHLDLKPDNILVGAPESGENRVKLIDFGLSEWKRLGVSGPGEFSGTPPYAAPELLLQKEASPASDIYSLGMIFHRLFAKEFPFMSQDPLVMMQAQVTQGAQKAKDLNPALPDTFTDLLMKMTEKDPKNRFTSISELVSAMNAALEENFSLRGSRAPAEILEESDRPFRPDLLARLTKEMQTSSPAKIALVGGPGLGKSRLLRRLKEILQLAQKSPLFFKNMPALPTGVSDMQPATTPVLIDGFSKNDCFDEKIETWLKNLPAPILIACENSEDVPAGFELEEIEALECPDLSDFLKKEIQDFPSESAAEQLLQKCQGRADLLEIALQALREEGLLHWGENGWRWAQKNAPIPSDLLQTAALRWEERRSKVLELLAFSPQGLDAITLSGILEIAPEQLEPKLRNWSSEGHLASSTQDGVLRYCASRRSDGFASNRNNNWREVLADLEKHYANGAFSLGAQLATFLEREFPDRRNIPSEVRILAARHYLSSGNIDAARAMLPEATPEEARFAGLQAEIQARIFLSLGDLESALLALNKAETAFQNITDGSGISRIYNLRGLAENKLGRRQAAIASFQKAIAESKAASDAYAQGLAEMNLGNLHLDEGLLEAARNFYEQALRSAETAKHPLLQIKLLQNRVNLLYTMGRAAEAELGAYELLGQALRANFPDEQAAALNFLSLFSGQRGDLDSQGRYLNQAIALTETHGKSPLRAQLYFNRAYWHWDANRFPAAQLDAEAALEMSTQLANSFLSAWARLLLGKILRDRAKPDLKQARAQLETARRLMDEQELRHLLWEADFDLGLLEKRCGDAHAARARFSAAKANLEALMPQLPEGQRQSYLRDRKLEKILEAMEDL